MATPVVGPLISKPSVLASTGKDANFSPGPSFVVEVHLPIGKKKRKRKKKVLSFSLSVKMSSLDVNKSKDGSEEKNNELNNQHLYVQILNKSKKIIPQNWK